MNINIITHDNYELIKIDEWEIKIPREDDFYPFLISKCLELDINVPAALAKIVENALEEGYSFKMMIDYQNGMCMTIENFDKIKEKRDEYLLYL